MTITTVKPHVHIQQYIKAACGAKEKAVFVDRDGTIVCDTGYPHKIEDLEIRNQFVEFLQTITANEIPIYMITNQSGVGRGYFPMREMFAFNDELSRRLLALNISMTAAISCTFFSKTSLAFKYRKPAPGMFFEIRDRYFVELTSSIMVGDTKADAIAAQRAGLRGCLLADAALVGFSEPEDSEDATFKVYDTPLDALDALLL